MGRDFRRWRGGGTLNKFPGEPIVATRMEISRKTFLRNLALGAAAASPLGGALSALAQGGSRIIDGEEVRSAIPLVPFLNHGPGFGRRVAFTFDDGPNPRTTPKVLAMLKERGIYSTFFMIGSNVARNGATAREVADAGHEIGNHTLTHPQLSKLPPEKVAYELGKTQELIHAATGRVPVWFRPPYGAFRHDQGPLAAAHGLGVMFWSVDSNDWRKPGPDKVAANVFGETGPGAVILTHDIHETTVEVLPRLLDGLIERGYEFTTVSGFLGSPYGGPPGTVPAGIVPAAPIVEPGAPIPPLAEPSANPTAG